MTEPTPQSQRAGCLFFLAVMCVTAAAIVGLVVAVAR